MPILAVMHTRSLVTFCLAVFAATFLLTAAPHAHAQGFVDQPVDTPYLGTIVIEVDATDTAHRVYRVKQSMPVRAGRLTLFFPRFLPGTHGPYGSIQRLAGLSIHSGRTPLAWMRDAVDPFAFHVEIAEGTAAIDVEFQYLARERNNGEEGAMTRDFIGLPWSQMVMYPAGHHATAIRTQASVKLPAGWKFATSLRTASRRGDVVQFEPVSLEELVDSPIYAGPHMARHELDAPGTARPVALNIFAGKASELEASAQQIDAHRKLVQQADQVFGSRHWNRYEFLLSLNEEIGFDGLEHHQSSENIVRPDYFKDWDKTAGARALLPHEFAHSWNGKFRRPADLLAPHFNLPSRNSLLWVYEGQTEYWGVILAARSGLITLDQARHDLARTLARLSTTTPGRRWRNLQDTTHQGIMRGRTLDTPWESWTRSEDYYDEAMLIWIEADMLIREQTNGTQSLDDFARTFFGVQDGRIDPLPYTFDDVVAALNAVHAYDWRTFLRERVDSVGRDAPGEGIARAGWKLDWQDTASPFDKARSDDRKADDFFYSLGFGVRRGKTTAVVWESPAFKVGMAAETEVLAVNDVAYNAERLDDALKANKDGRTPIRLLLKEGDRFRTVTIDYREGPRHPRLVRVEGRTERLDAALFAPR